MTSALPGTHWLEKDTLHINVRGLSPPDPMVAILGRLEGLGQSAPVIIHHDRDPIYLYPELTERGWSSTRIPGDPGEVRLRLTKDA